jgi:predicted acetyltransferase
VDCPPDVNPHGEYLHRYFDEYWTDPDRKAFLFRAGGALAGFALVFTGDRMTSPNSL